MRLTPARASSVNFMALKYSVVQELVIVVSDLYLSRGRSRRLCRAAGARADRAFWNEKRGSPQAGGPGLRVMSAAQPWPRKRRPAWLHAAALRKSRAPCGLRLPCTASPGSRACIWTIAAFSNFRWQRSTHLLPIFRRYFRGRSSRCNRSQAAAFSLAGPASADAHAPEPARCVGMNMAAALPRSPALRRLGAEIEIWLHEHPVNRARSERGELPVTGLWLWGGWNMCACAARADRGYAPCYRPRLRSRSVS